MVTCYAEKTDISMTPIKQHYIISPETVLEMITRVIIITREPDRRRISCLEC